MPYHVEISGRLVRESERAILVEFGSGRSAQQHWLPRSQLKRLTRIGDRVSASIPGWLADKCGLA